MIVCLRFVTLFFFFNDTATTEIYTLSLHDALPILALPGVLALLLLQGIELDPGFVHSHVGLERILDPARDRKSTRLNSSHANISYAVFCLKKKKKTLFSI